MDFDNLSTYSEKEEKKQQELRASKTRKTARDGTMRAT